MIVYPNCKINLGLRILRKRADGYHDLETIFYPIKLNDMLEVLPGKPMAGLPVQLSLSGIPVSGNAADNLCVKAWHLLKNAYPELPPVQLHLHKIIPTGAGLGGGSADAAFTLLLLNKLFRLNCPMEQLAAFALQLGSDCPFFLTNSPCLATGRGEILTPVPLDLNGYALMLVNPGIHVSTAAAFAGITPAEPATSVNEIIQLPVSQWKDRLLNDFEKTVFAQHPEIAAIKDTLYAAGAVYAAMSGSGSTVFGLFPAGQVPDPGFPESWFIKKVSA